VAGWKDQQGIIAVYREGSEMGSAAILKGNELAKCTSVVENDARFKKGMLNLRKRIGRTQASACDKKKIRLGYMLFFVRSRERERDPVKCRLR
jgi:hypothetical protein